MREIKFRAWDKKKKELFYQKDSPLEFFHVIALFDEEPEIMQYAGLYDKNGKEIYEGDIFSHPEYTPPFKSVVNLCVGFKDGMFQCGRGTTPEWWTYALRNFNEAAEILGNIYENPELMKERK